MQQPYLARQLGLVLSFQTVHSVQGANEYTVLQCTLRIHLLIQFLLRPVWVRADRVTVNSELERVRQYYLCCTNYTS